MAEFVKVATVAELPDPGKKTVELDDALVVVIRVDGQYYCIDDVCTHDGGPLGDGELCDHTIACPRHGAKFDVRNGRALTMPATGATKVHEIRLDGDDIYVRLAED